MDRKLQLKESVIKYDSSFIYVGIFHVYPRYQYYPSINDVLVPKHAI